MTYRQPFKVVGVTYGPSTARPTAHTDYEDRVPSQGYTYSKPSVKFGSSTASSISSNDQEVYGFETKTTKGSRTDVVKIGTNYDRGSVKFTPSGYETYDDNDSGFDKSSGGDKFTQESYTPSFGGSGQSYGSSKTSSVEKSSSGGYNRAYSTTPTYETKAQPQGFESSVEIGSSGYENTNGNVGVSTTYLPGRKISSSTRRPSVYSSTSPAVTTYSGSYGRVSSTPYEVTTASSTVLAKPKGRGKVIVKFSDLHPLLLGKLGAECTCKADPFATFRGTKPLPINSNKGPVDLRNYDESDVYVDLESSKENGDYNSGEDVGDSPDDDDDGKYETPVVAVFNGVTQSSKSLDGKSRRPSSAYLPVSSTTRPSSSTYQTPSSTYLPAASAALSSRGGVRASSYANSGASVSASFSSARGGGFRVGKTLDATGQSSANALPVQGASFDRYGPGGLRGVDETLQGNSDCSRPGLFRHPNFCNKFYACHWDEWKKSYTLHVFNCPVHLTFDSGASACNWPSKGPACQDDNLLV